MKVNERVFDVLRKNSVFNRLAAEVSETSRIIPSEYVLRKDGTFIFVETVFMDDSGREFIIGNPVRIPKNPSSDLKIGKIEKIFDVEIYNIMKIFKGNKMSDSHFTQKEAIRKVQQNQEGTDYGIEPFQPADLHIGSNFDRQDFIYHFPMKKTLEYNLEMGVESVQKAVSWASRDLGLDPGDLGLTGSSSLGIIDPDEDVDLCFFSDLDGLVRIKNVIHEGVVTGKYTAMEEFGHVWPLRAVIDEFELCPFFIPSDYEMYHANIRIDAFLGSLEVVVTEDRFNMLSPILLKVEDAGKNLHELLITNGFNRGHFFQGDRLRLTDVHEVTVKSSKRTFGAWMIKAWNDAVIL